MSADAALLERMGNAVRQAYKAMEVLKAENRLLKQQNEELQKQLRALRGDAEVMDELDRVDKIVTCVNEQGADHGQILDEALISSPKRTPGKTPVPVTSVQEMGLTKFAFRSFHHAPDANSFVEQFGKLAADNVHFVASTVCGHSPETICKALIVVISSYCNDNVGLLNNISLTKTNCSQPMTLIPTEVLVRLDRLATMLVSIASRGPSGLIKATKICEVLRKGILGSVRFQLSSPHYAVVMGALRVTRNNTVYTPPPRASTTADSTENTAVPTSHSASSATATAPEQDDKKERKHRMAALSSMMGLDSSDSDSECDSHHSNHSSDVDNDPHREGDNSDVDEDAMPQEGDAKMEVERHSEDVHGDVRLQEPDEVLIGTAARSENDEDRSARSAVQLASRVYVLFTTYLRLGVHDDLARTLHDLRLVTLHNWSDGCALGVVAVFGSRRFAPTLHSNAKTALCKLLGSWRNMGYSTSIGTSAPGIGAEVWAELLQMLWSAQNLSAQESLSAVVVSQGTVQERIAAAQQRFRDNVVGMESGGSSDLDAMVHACRSLGFWEAVTEFTGEKGSNASASRATTDPFSYLGLDRTVTQARRWCALLDHWNPAAAPGTEPFDSSLGGNPAVLSFLQSDDFTCSSIQDQALAALKAAKVSPLKWHAQDLLVAILQKNWTNSLFADASSTETAAKRVFHALDVAQVLLESVLQTEYDAAEGGWRTGVTGNGYRLESRLENRLTVGIALLKKLSFASHFVFSTLGFGLRPSLHWQHLSSCSGRKLAEYAHFVDHCENEVFSVVRAAGGSEWGERDVEVQKTVVKLHAVCAEIVSLLALVGVENVISVTVSSLRGLLRSVFAHSKAIQQSDAYLSQIVDKTIRVLAGIPAPWAGSSRAEIASEMQACAHRMMVSTAKSGALSKELRLFCAAATLGATMAMPVFVINLDKRTDRLRRTLVMLEQAGVSVVRIRAWDGTGDMMTTSAAEMFQRNFGAPGEALRLADAAVDGARPLDEYSDIPESDVALTWDSTLNSKFDLRCAANKNVIATTSERACAASHLKAWRTIAAVLGMKEKGKLSSKLARFGADVPVVAQEDDEHHTASEVYRSLTAGRAVAGKCQSSLGDGHLATYFPDPVGGKYFIVFEDDVSFPQQSLCDLRHTISSLMRTLPADVDILYLGGLMPKAAPDFKLKHRKGEPFYEVNYMWTLQAYVLRRRAVEVLLSKLPIWAPVDNFVASLIYHKELKAYIVQDKLTQKVAPISTVAGTRRDDSDVRPSGRSHDASRKRKPQDGTLPAGKKGKGKRGGQATIGAATEGVPVNIGE